VSLTTKIFLGTAFVVAAVLGAMLAVTAQSARKTAETTVNKALADAREQINTQLDERRSALAGQAEVFVKNAGFRASVESKKFADVLDQSQEAATQIGASWVQITGDNGIRLAKSNEPGADTVDFSGTALIGGALAGESKAGYGVDGTVLIQTVAVPIQGTSQSHVIGVLMAVRALDSTFAASLKAADGTGADIVLFALDTLDHPQVVASTIGRSADLARVVGSLKKVPAADPARADSLSRDVTMQLDETIGGTNFVALAQPLRSASGAQFGGFLVLRNKDAEFAAFYRLRNIILGGGALGLLIAGLLSFAIARQITRPVMQLVDATKRAADGDYSADITVKAGGEIGTLANAFRAMLSDLRDKQALVEFLGGATAGEAKTVRVAAVPGTIASAAQPNGITPGQRFAVRYEVKELLGVGGMGMVFKAVDSELGEMIAIKTLKQELLSEDASALERFKSEIRLARRISHRNVVRTHDLGEFAGVYFITMEYVEGTTLKELVRRRGRLPISATLTVAKQLCRALEVAHEQGVIHRDIKPQNMVVEPSGVLKVMDFGIARLAKRQAGVTQQGMVVGTPEYMAPEQLMGQDIDVRADIYAAGCVIYECLTGTPPLTADNQFALIAKLLEDVPVAPISVNREVPQALSDLVMRTLSKRAGDRPQTALELHDLLAAIG
jgi:HAMP domain-containing protein/predicted Ser/Thr protein kinase/type II secretory pathway pseudopilin PulG